MTAYSFLDVNCSMVSPTGIANLGSGSGVTEEGIELEASEDKNVMTIGADGKGQHSLVASDGCLLTLRYLKTSPVNALLQTYYDAQSISSALWGQNVFTITNTATGDYTVVQSAAFKKKPKLVYSKVGEMIEWTFDGITQNSILGGGI
jgi:Protein of unknown function (DUF3277)